MTVRDAATQAQVDAARPDLSTWLSANAGSGKTRVLTDRVARLLLDGVNPQHILCLTYTKAAASEMQIRLFDTLGRWAMMPDGDLAAALDDLGHAGETGPDMLRRARRLFAQAIETPGGLRIQTIHAFCAALLRRFPLEAGVTPDFTEIDDQTARLLRAEIIEQIAVGPEAPVLAALARHHAEESLDKLAIDILARQADFAAAPDDAALCAALDQPGDLSRESIAAAVFLGSERALLDGLLPVLRAGSKTDGTAADRLATLTALDFDALPVLEAVFLTGAGAKAPFTAKIGSFPTKATREALAPVMDGIEQWMARVETAREARLALLTVERTRVLHDFARAFIRRYSSAKQRRGLLDFDDLILRARDLLTDPSVAAWVLYRIDGGIDHILVDEAQDTSPVQWQVIERLAQEFTAGEGARADVARTLFVVGDRKQSIYSFQGADAREFDRMRREFGHRLTPARAAARLFLPLVAGHPAGGGHLPFGGRGELFRAGSGPHRVFRRAAWPGRSLAACRQARDARAAALAPPRRHPRRDRSVGDPRPSHRRPHPRASRCGHRHPRPRRAGRRATDDGRRRADPRAQPQPPVSRDHPRLQIRRPARCRGRPAQDRRRTGGARSRRPPVVSRHRG